MYICESDLSDGPFETMSLAIPCSRDSFKCALQLFMLSTNIYPRGQDLAMQPFAKGVVIDRCLRLFQGSTKGSQSLLELRPLCTKARHATQASKLNNRRDAHSFAKTLTTPGSGSKRMSNKEACLVKKQSHKAFPENGFLSNSAKENHVQPRAASINLGPPQSRARGKARTARAGGARIPFKITKPKRGLCGGALEKVGGQMSRPKWNP